MLPAPNDPPLPTASLDTLFSYYPYFPISARQRAHASLRAAPYPPSSSSSSSRPTPSASERRRDARRAVTRASLRAIRGERPAGVSIGLDAADLSDEEEAVEEEKAQVNAFGHRFLLPFGRRLTQMEMEAAPSPTPSDHEHRQEDHQHAANRGAGSPLPAPSERGDDTEAAVVDLDASMEDRDDVTGAGDPSTEYDPDRSTEYDSDDLRLMRNMDNSVGSETPESHEESDEDIVEEDEDEDE